MKIIRIAENKIANIIIIANHYKVQYTDGVNPEVKTITLRNMESREQAEAYVRHLTRNKGKIVGKAEEISIKEPSPAPKEKSAPSKPSLPRNVKVISPLKPSGRPLPQEQAKGWKIQYLLDTSDGTEKEKVAVYEDAESREDAEMLFDVEFPKAQYPRKQILQFRNLTVKPAPMSYDETGKPVGVGKKDWISDRSKENLPRDIALERMKQNLRKKLEEQQ